MLVCITLCQESPTVVEEVQEVARELVLAEVQAS